MRPSFDLARGCNKVIPHAFLSRIWYMLLPDGRFSYQGLQQGPFMREDG